MVSMLKISLSRQKGQPEAPDLFLRGRGRSRWIGRMDVLIEDISHTKSNLGIA